MGLLACSCMQYHDDDSACMCVVCMHACTSRVAAVYLAVLTRIDGPLYRAAAVPGKAVVGRAPPLVSKVTRQEIAIMLFVGWTLQESILFSREKKTVIRTMYGSSIHACRIYIHIRIFTEPCN